MSFQSAQHVLHLFSACGDFKTQNLDIQGFYNVFELADFPVTFSDIRSNCIGEIRVAVYELFRQSREIIKCAPLDDITKLELITHAIDRFNATEGARWTMTLYSK